MKFYSESEYQEECRALFKKHSSKIQSSIPEATVEHVGSSSIPGLISKGDLDIYIGVPKDRHPSAVEILVELGYLIKSDTLRTDELCMLVSNNDDVALQVVAKGSEFEFFIKFRDLLRSNPKLVAAYNDLKLSCSSFSPNEYRSVKSTFIEQALKNA